MSLVQLLELLSWSNDHRCALKQAVSKLRSHVANQRRGTAPVLTPQGAPTPGDTLRELQRLEGRLGRCVTLAESCLAAVLVSMLSALRTLEVTRNSAAAEELLQRVEVMQVCVHLLCT